jgi:cytochrome c2
MQALVSSFWAARFFEDAGRPKAGAGVFAAKKCRACHQNASSGAPQLPVAGREFSGAAMLSALWKHGPNMLDQMKIKGVAWPRFEGKQMADLIAYLNAKHP